MTVKYNNDKSRDYTNPTLPSGDGNMSQPIELDRMHAYSAQRSVSNEDYRYGKNDKSKRFAFKIENIHSIQIIIQEDVVDRHQQADCHRRMTWEAMEII